MNKRSNTWFIVGCSILAAIVVGLVFWLAPPRQGGIGNDDPTPPATAETTPGADESTAPPRKFTLTAEQKANIARVLRVYYVTPSQRKETFASVKALITDDLAYELEHQWDGLMPNSKATISKLKFVGAAVIDGEQRVSVTLIVTTTYINASTDTQPWAVSITLQGDGKVSGIDDMPGDGG